MEDSAWLTLHFHAPGFQYQTRRLTQTNTTDEGFSFSFHKNYKLDPTYPRLAIFSLRELHQTSPYQSDPPENQIWHTDEAGASLACYQRTLISGTSFFRQWYFPSSGRSPNEILWEIVATSPFPSPSPLRRSVARSREARFTLPNRRACSQAIFWPIPAVVLTLETSEVSAAFLTSFPCLTQNSSISNRLWWIMRVLLVNQNKGNVLNE